MKGTIIRHVPAEAATRTLLDPMMKAVKDAVTEDYGQERGRATLAKVPKRITTIDWKEIGDSVGQTEVVLPAWRRPPPRLIGQARRALFTPLFGVAGLATDGALARCRVGSGFGRVTRGSARGLTKGWRPVI